MISTRSGVLVIDTVVSLTLSKWETVSGQFGGNLKDCFGGISRGDIQSVNHKTAPPRKPLSPEICPGYSNWLRG